MLKVFKIGHYTDETNGTGCTVILPPADAVASASVRGAAPGTRELALLAPERKITHINALFLTGGSAFGLNAVQGVVEYLEASGHGYETIYGIVPIVPAAVIFDLNIGNSRIRPTATNARTAAESARFENDDMGSVGAGTGATVGKWRGIGHAMKGGLGIAREVHGDLKVLALTVVNSVGDIMYYDGSVFAGAVSPEGHFIAETDHRKRWGEPAVGMAENTVLSVLLCNAAISKQQAYYIADRSHFGIARRIEPSHTSFDGDITFILAKPEIPANIDLLSSMAVRATEESVLNAVRAAKGICGIRSLHDLKGGS